MNLLLDTQVFLWAVERPRRLSMSARERIGAADTVYVSAASIWEAAIKVGLGKLRVDADLVAAIPQAGFVELPVLARHALLVSTLPRIHRDPFDRLLIAQAIHEPLQLLTTDTTLQRYPAVVKIA